ncbi:hypothetical protein OJF2_41540 [Aquisphaera giovannonii]|uniref:Uncharacterized protein n=1 Tax=Aquisphaera giovannonii TaxID=406548 RepID=A0A5B9W6K2_9BACT|nr:hypothetical protein OJF2_41540 [Aquisphaera giovannonii]
MRLRFASCIGEASGVLCRMHDPWKPMIEPAHETE